MLITPEYRKLNAELHAAGTFGVSGWRWIGPIIYFMRKYDAKSILDYGCGDASLAKWWPLEWPVFSYDPVTFPKGCKQPQDFTVCLDVLEHIEPDCLDDVLAHIRSKTLKAAFFVISTRPAKKLLSDGRNAHLIIQDKHWWLPKLREHFRKAGQIKRVGHSDELVVTAIV